MEAPAHAVGLDSPLATESAVPLAPPRLWRILMFPLKFFWGMVFCQGLAGSLLVVGWTYRLAQRTAFQCWSAQAQPKRIGTGFTRFLAGHKDTRPHVHWPNWFARQNFHYELQHCRELSPGTRALGLFSALVQSLWQNFWIGLRGIVNTWLVTLPAGILWWFGWYDGWNNSFNKGYEQAAVGPLISLLGIAWFIGAMFYVPLAQARQAVTGEWRAFFQFRLVRKLARDRWVFCVLLAGLYSVLAIPLSVLKTSPMFWMHNSPALARLSPDQVVTMLRGYYFWCALAVLPGFVLAHVLAARIYASGLLALLRSGKLSAAELAPLEREVLNRLGLLTVQASAPRPAFVRFITWTGTRVGRAAGNTALVLIWFSLVAQIYIAQFLNYHSGLGWMNQTLVQLPWFRYLPGAVHNPLSDIVWALLILLLALLVRSILRATRARR